MASKEPTRIISDLVGYAPLTDAITSAMGDATKMAALYTPASQLFLQKQSEVNSVTFLSIQFEIEGQRKEGKGGKKDTSLTSLYSNFTIS